MELKWLEDFLSLCETGNFRISSENRCVSQPAFSRRLKSLENWVGAKLIDRSSQPARLTEAGEIFKPVAQEIARLANQSRSDINGKKEKIRISTLSTLAQFFVPGWLNELQSLTETETFSVRSGYGSVGQYLSALEEGQIDFFIGYEDPSGAILNDTAKFCSLQLGTETLVPVVNPDKNGKPEYWLPTISPGSSIPYLHTYSNPQVWPVRHHLEIRFSDLNFVPVYESSTAAAIREMVLKGYGVAWIPKSIVANDLKSGALVRAATADDDISVNIVVYRYKLNSVPGTEKFWQILLQQEANKPEFS
ncbi:MAG: LysR family transcriptional regulator [Proteobacteria bacterium]|nr:LysR family transcriptional regulator [Pseudomonadota bacterium]